MGGDGGSGRTSVGARPAPVGAQTSAGAQESKMAFLLCGLRREVRPRPFWKALILQCKGKQVVGIRDKGYTKESREFKSIIVKSVASSGMEVRIALEFGTKGNLG